MGHNITEACAGKETMTAAKTQKLLCSHTDHTTNKHGGNVFDDSLVFMNLRHQSLLAYRTLFMYMKQNEELLDSLLQYPTLKH